MKQDTPSRASDPADASQELRVPSVRELFFGFLELGFISFGGAMPLIRHHAVDRYRWVTLAEFTDLIGLCQFLPGGNVINFAAAVGMRFRGWRGAVAALVGLIAGPSLVVIGLGILYERLQDSPHVRHLFIGLAAAAAGLLIEMAVRIMMPLRYDLAAAFVALLSFIAVAILRLPLLPTMLVLTPLGIFIAARAARGGERTKNTTRTPK